MQDRPTASELLEAALAAYVRDLLPEIPGEKRYMALMVANALAIVGRDLAQGEALLQKEIKRLQELLTLPSSEIKNSDSFKAEAESLNRQLVAQIRTGAFDEQDAARDLQAHLVATTAEKLATSNPKALRGKEEA